MPRDGSNVYHVPAGTTAVTDTTIESAKYNAYTADVEQDLNLPRPIVAGGTGAATAAAALAALSGEQAKQIITNYSSDTFVPGSFYSATTATNAPVAAHAFAGICYAADATNMVIEARDLTDANHNVYVRIMSAGVWGAFGGLNVLKAGDTMTGLLTLSGDPSTALQAATKQYVDTKAVVFASDTAPAGGSTNSLWWETDTGLMYFLYNDGDSTQWVVAMPQPDTTQLVAKAGDTMTGLLTLSGNPSTALQAAPKQYVDTLRSYVDAIPILQNYLTGLVLSTAGASATFSIAKGQASDSTNVSLMTLASAYTKTTSAWTVGSGNGALDTGAIAISTWYHVHLIKRLDTGIVDVLFSLSPTAPTLPTSYTVFRRIGSMKTNASSQWTKFVQLGDEFLWDVPAGDTANFGVGTTATLFVLSVPTSVQVWAMIRITLQNASSVPHYAVVTSPDESIQTVTTGSGVNINVGLQGVVGNGSAAQLTIRTNTSSQIRVVADASSSPIWINTNGWIDLRGKL